MLRPPDQFFWRWALVVYWALLFVGTHIPTTPVIVPAGGDKLAHFIAYALLAWLLAAAWGPRGSVTHWPVLAILAFTLGYAALDEWMQPFFGRHCSSADWFADACGAGAGLGAYAAGTSARRPGRHVGA